MGKKKMPKKTKELSVAIAESSSMGEETQQQQIITPRKRGRPRKIVEKTESEEIKEAEEIKVEEEAETESKKTKMIGEKEEKEQHVEEAAGATSAVVKELQPQRRSSRARRKSKPRKSS
ncbi:hypothetical protein RHMOL_Rhmol06G0044000 [Rhododendron molle]|uniref:Uncharacterized protein n=1 Tax=Rhododendron molle TaxID=49168 RepID=A0ACC0N8V3_RHOML|nr:hypothetical protein RHMOL_Rhmol06G0044000 [Rhododendron molle]